MRHLPIYVFGSEGVYVYNDCDRALAEQCRRMSRETVVRKKAEFLTRRSAA